MCFGTTGLQFGGVPVWPLGQVPGAALTSTFLSQRRPLHAVFAGQQWPLLGNMPGGQFGCAVKCGGGGVACGG
jgi:hypothetical protein